MKRKAIAAIMLTLLLANVLSLTFVVTPAIADNNPNEVLNVEEITQPNSIKSSESLLNSISKDTLPLQEKLREENSSYPPSKDKCNLNETNYWKDFAYIDGNKTRLVVRLKNSKATTYADLESLVIKKGGEIVNTVSMNGEIIAVVIEIPLNAMSSFETDVRTAGLASYVEPNMKFQINLVPDDPYWSWQWGPQKIEADWAWNTTIGDPSVLVAVVDTGIDWDHPDLAANYVPLGYDWVNNDPNPMDDHGHGTHCAGIIAAVINNGIGIAGLAQVQIMAEKGLSAGGYGYEDWLANAIIHAVDQGADIISMSWGGYFHSELIYEAIRYAYDAGVLLVAAAGNEATNVKSFPAGYDEVIAVVATDSYDGRPYWTNYGDWVELAAPGVNIYSTVWDDGYMYASGTSMACPHVAGVAALVWSKFTGKARDWVRLWLRYTTDDLGDLGFDIYYGYGRINARKAVEQVPPDHELIISGWETPPYVKPEGFGIINATILNFGENDETNVTVQLLANGTVVNSTSIGFLASGTSATISHSWSPIVEGLYNVTLYVTPVLGETMVENNVVWKYIYVGFPVKAVVLDSAGTDVGDVIATWQALNINWHLFGGTMIYIDYTTLNKENISYEDIVASEADVLIISCASDPGMGWQFTDSEIEAIKRYVQEGHGLIATAGTLYSYVPNNNKLAPLFGLNESITWYATQTDLLHIEEPNHPLFVKVPNPFIFSRVGTNIPSDGRWDANELVDGKYMALGHFGESAIVVRRGLVYISPLLEIIPAYYHHHLQLFYNAITWSRYQKPEHELLVSLEAPTRLKPGESTLLNATVSNLGRSNETDVELQLLINGALVSSITIPELLVGSSYTMSYQWTPAVQGISNITAYAPPVPDEELIGNNVATKMVMVLLIVAEKVLVYTDDYYMEPSSRYAIVALDNLGVNYTHYADDPSGFGYALTRQPWDLVIVDHDNWYALGNWWTELEAYVRGGGLLILSTFDIDGSSSEPTTLWDTLGVQYVSDMPYPEPVYRWIPAHPMFTFPNNVSDLTSYIEGYGDDGDHVRTTTGTAVAGFTTSPTEGYAGIVVGNEYQTVLFSFLLCEFRYDQDADGKLDAVELWENAIVYVTMPLQHDIAVTLDAPKALKPGQSSLLNATVSNKGLSNETDVVLRILIDGLIVESATIPELLVGDSYTLSHLWTPKVEGMYNVTAYAPPVPDEDNMRNNMKSAKVFVSLLTVALFQNWCSWDYPSNEEALNRYSVPYVVFRSSDFGSVDLSGFTKVVIASDQDQAFYNGMDAYRWWFEDYVNNGGILEIHAADYGWHGGGWVGPLPGGLQWASYYGQYVTVVDPLHPVLNTPNTITEAELDNWNWAVHGYFSIYPADAHIIIIEDSTRMPAYLEFGYGSGFIIASSQTLEWAYKRRFSLILENSLLYTPIKYGHDIAVTLKAPALLEPTDSVLLNATVHNRGLNNETGVELQLLINGTVADFVVIPELLTGASYTLSYLWTPTVEGIYNVTGYAPPIADEEFTANNIATKIVLARYAPKLLVVDTPQAEDTGALDKLGYEYTLVSPTEFATVNLYEFNVLFVGWVPGDAVVNALLARASEVADWVAAGNGIVALSEPYESNRWAWLPLWVNSDTYGGENVRIIDPTHPVMFNLTDAELSYWWSSYHGCFYSYHTDWAALAQGIEAGYPITLAATYGNGRIVITHQDPDYHFYYNNVLGAGKLLRNMIEWATPYRYQHDLAVSLDAPACLELSHSVLLNVTVRNRGLNNETDVDLYLLINGTIVSSTTIPELLVGKSHTINHTWTPTETGNYNVTAYSPPVIGEEYLPNNIQTKRAKVWSYWRLYLPIEWVGDGVPMGWHADDNCWQYTLPFDFPFYCNSYRTIYISSNGLLTFIDPDTSFDNSISALANKLAIAPAWDDWDTHAPRDIYIWQNSTHISIRWYVAAHYNMSTVANFEAILAANGVIQFNYGYNNGPISATIGISNGAGHILAEDVSNVNYIRTIVFAPYPLKNDVAIVSVEPSAHEVLVGDTVDVTVVTENRGNATESFTVTAYASPSNSTKLLVLPPYVVNESLAPGMTFAINASVANVVNLGMWQISLYFDPAVLNCTGASYPSDHVFAGKSYLPVDPVIDNVGGSVMYGCCILGMDTFSGNGTLCQIEFKVMSRGYSTLVFSRPYGLDTLMESPEGLIEPVTLQDGYFDNREAPPPLPPEVYKIGTITVTNLPLGARITLTFTWNTTGVIPKDYRIWAYASPVQGETDIDDNTYIDGIVRVEKPPFASFTYSPPFPKAGEIVTFNATDSTPDGGIIVSYGWNFGDGNTTTTEDPIITHVYTFSGIYNVTLTITDSAGLTDSTRKTIYVMTRDIAMVEVTPSTDRTYVGRTITINVTVTNKGEINETFDVILYYNITLGDTIGTQTVRNLIPGEHRTLTFLWNTTNIKPCHDYEITAYVVPVHGETNIVDNKLSSPILVKIKMLGDVNGDGKVDMKDIYVVAKAFGSYGGHPSWNSNADLNSDGKIDMKDIYAVAIRFGECL